MGKKCCGRDRSRNRGRCRKLYFDSVTPDVFELLVGQVSATISFSVFGSSKCLPTGTTVLLQYVQKRAPTVPVAIGSTTIDACGNWSFFGVTASIPDVSLGNLRLIASAIQNTALAPASPGVVIAVAMACIRLTSAAPVFPYVPQLLCCQPINTSCGRKSGKCHKKKRHH